MEKVQNHMLFLFFFLRWALAKLESTTTLPPKSRVKCSCERAHAESQPAVEEAKNIEKKKDVTRQVNIALGVSKCNVFLFPLPASPIETELSSGNKEKFPLVLLS